MFGKLSDEEQTEGIIIRSEEVLNVEKGQKIQKIKENNEKVSKNEVVAKVSTQNEQDIMNRKCFGRKSNKCKFYTKYNYK